VYFTVRAFNPGGYSPSSNEICRGPGVPCGTVVTPPPTNPPPTNPPPTGGTLGITGFKLWNASTDVVVDDDFQNNDQVTVSCAAVEIVGSVGGSIRKTFDGVVGACENSAPFGFPDGSVPSQFECMPSLGNGTHTLSAQAFTAKDCTGTPGTPLSRTFSVNVGSAPPPPAALGTPGKPYLVQ
jgi:hypothetical protein